MGLVERCFIEISFIEPPGINVQCLFVNFCGVKASCQYQWSVHLTTAICRQNFSAEIQQAVHQEHDGVFITIAISSLGCVEERMRITARTIGPPDDTRKDPSAGVWCKGTDEMTNQVFGFCHVVIRFSLVIPYQQFIDVTSGPNKEVTCIFCHDEVLREDFQHLFIVLQWLSEVIVGISEIEEFLPRNINFPWAEMRDWNVAHVVPDRSISEHRQVVFCSENAFFNGLRGLISTAEFFHALDLIR